MAAQPGAARQPARHGAHSARALTCCARHAFITRRVGSADEIVSDSDQDA